ncbi:MAG: hypothetical protein J6O51_01085 [Bacteroidales bacterium]|nr:hypothetical protein [Bacteroidales bacterium]
MRLNRLLLTIGILSLASCQSELSQDTVKPGDTTDATELILTAQSELPSGTRTILDFPALTWEDSDCIAVFDGKSKNLFSITEGGNHGTSATFKGEVAQGATELYAVNPADAAQSCSDGSLTVSLPSVQRIPDGRQASPEALISVAKAEGGKLGFRNVVSLVKVSIVSEDITAVIILGRAIAGSASVAPTGVLSGRSSSEDMVKLLPQDGTFAPGDYYAAVLPGTTPAGSFSISLVRSDAKSCTRTSTKEQTLQRNACKSAGDISGAGTWQQVIYTKDQLFAWNTLRTPADAEDKVQLGADIDMEMAPWTPRDFAGSFDGRGHKLYNINVVSNNYAGFLRELTGSASVKDVTIGSQDGASYDGSSVISHSKSANNYTWYYAGAIAKVSGSGSVSGVVNFATVEVAADATSKTRIGGVVGNWNSTGTLKGCTNYGTVRNLSPVTGQKTSSDTTPQSSLMGGVLGFFDVRNTISDCANYGSVLCSNPYVSAIGGVVGYDGRGSTVSECTNAGSVSQQAASINVDTAVGGIIGYALGSSSAYGHVQSCTNEGRVSACGDGAVIRPGGVCGYADYYLLSDCSNSGTVNFSNASATTGYIAIGGVCGHTYHSCVLTSCTNSGPVSSDKPQVNRIGGVVGTLNSSSAKGCVNTGTVTLDNSSRSIGNWESAGGIAGFAEGTTNTREISGCTNEGSVSMSVNTTGRDTPGRVAAGGIVGMPYSDFSIVGNINKAAVSVQNKQEYGFAGGIFGMDAGSSKVSSYSANCNFGDVSGIQAGAVAGANSASFTATVCDALTVNGSTHGAASDKDQWACPMNSGSITLIVKPHTPDEDGSLPKPLDPGNKVVAHRGGATECGYPDNSRAALRYAMSLGCYASECDIYWTSDNNVIVAHADGNDQINGMNPFEHTAAEIQAAARLSNYERIPTLAEYIDIVMEPGSKTKLLLDIKMIDTPTLDYDHPAKAALRAIEIIQEKGAQNFCEFICTGYDGVMKKIADAVKASGIPCGWMNGGISAATFKSRGYTDWANLCTRDHFKLGASDAPDKGTGNRTIQEFKNAGLQLSVFHLDKQSGSSSAVYTDATVQLYLDEYAYLRCITTNYPAWLLQKTKGL